MSLNSRNKFKNNSITLKLCNLLHTVQETKYFLFESSSWLLILVNHVSSTINRIILNKKYGFPSPYFHKLKKQIVLMYHVQLSKLSHCMLFSFLVRLLRDTIATTCEITASVGIKNP